MFFQTKVLSVCLLFFKLNFDCFFFFFGVFFVSVSRINLNCQCQRGPDSFPFCGRKDSAYGTLSVGDALRVFSIRALVATKETPTNKNLVAGILQTQSSNFLRMDYLF
jgi:glyceraldehyde-3-phosphate dehydrogenase (NADP+)